MIGKLATLANAFKSFTELITGQKSSAESSGVTAVASAATDAGDSLSGASDAAGNLTSNTDKAGKAAENAAKKMKSLMGFDKINKVDSNDTSTGSSGSGSTAADREQVVCLVVRSILEGWHRERQFSIRRISAWWWRMFLILALCLTGTPSQLHRFISSLENGMYSRMAFISVRDGGNGFRQLLWRVAPTM